jgi:hypothetical protein
MRDRGADEGGIKIYMYRNGKSFDNKNQSFKTPREILKLSREPQNPSVGAKVPADMQLGIPVLVYLSSTDRN